MEENNKWVVAAAKVAQRLHKDQKDKAGVDYFSGHLSYVASLEKHGRKRLLDIFMMQMKIHLIVLTPF